MKFKEVYVDLLGDMSVLVENAERILGKDIPELSPIQKADLSSLLSDIRDISQKMETVGETYGGKVEEMLKIHDDINLCMQGLVNATDDPLAKAVHMYVSGRLNSVERHILTPLWRS